MTDEEIAAAFSAPPDPVPTETVLEGMVTWTHAKSNEGWSLATVSRKGQKNAKVVAKFRLQAGQPVRLEGEWVDDDRWGLQFRAVGHAVERVGSAGLREWLAREVDGCGPVKADKAVAAYGEALYDALVGAPRDVAVAVGLDPDVLAVAVDGRLRGNLAATDMVGRLRLKGCPAGLAARIVDQLTPAGAEKVLADPYHIIGRVERAGWKTADDLGRAFGVPPDAPTRLAAAVTHACLQLSEGEGHTAYSEGQLVDQLGQTLGLPPARCLEAVAGSDQVFLYEPGLYAHRRYADAERLVERAVADNPRMLPAAEVEALADRFAKLEDGTPLQGRQLAAFKAAMYSRVVVITGSAGTGKSTVLRAIANAFDDLRLYPALCAPTGKAANRISETTGRNATTIHRLYGLVPGMEGKPRPPIPNPAVIADEFSMVPSDLAATVFTAVPEKCRVVAVGDPNQLPSVGAGAVLRDLIASRRVPHVHLDVVYRQAGTLLGNCNLVLRGGGPELFHAPPRGEWPTAPWVFHQLADPTVTRASLANLFAGACRDKLGVEPHDLMVITPTNKGPLGVVELNRMLQRAYQEGRHRDVPPTDGRIKLMADDRVVFRKNVVDAGAGGGTEIMNGDIGRVLEAHDDWVRVLFEIAGAVDLRGKYLEYLDAAWAITCHRAQGSQFRKGIVLVTPDHAENWGLKNVMSRSWLYTAVTRFEEACVLLGDAQAVRDVLGREQRDSRVTTLFRGVGR